ncbi:MAG: hypothetical protein F4X91_08295, partial [Nitrospinae bacterium]|nr:hypothetical protein [Nitrospinota bacterium]
MNETGVETAVEETTEAVKLKIIDADIHPRMNGMHRMLPLGRDDWRSPLGVAPLGSAWAPTP